MKSIINQVAVVGSGSERSNPLFFFFFTLKITSHRNSNNKLKNDKNGGQFQERCARQVSPGMGCPSPFSSPLEAPVAACPSEGSFSFFSNSFFFCFLHTKWVILISQCFENLETEKLLKMGRSWCSTTVLHISVSAMLRC